MCYNGAWNSVCDSGWDYQETFVVCRQLGLPATGNNNNNNNNNNISLEVWYI